MGNFWLIWTISFNKTNCKWGELTSKETHESGIGAWNTDTNAIFCTYTYHSSIMNDESTPDKLPNTTVPPPSAICPMQYRVWRSVHTDLVSSKPFIVNIVEESGDDKWSLVTPFEWEYTESKNVFISQCPQALSEYNRDDRPGYSIYSVQRTCVDGVIFHISGPTSVGRTEEAGDEKWHYDTAPYYDPLIGYIYTATWTSSILEENIVPTQYLTEDDDELYALCQSFLNADEEIEDGKIPDNEPREEDDAYYNIEDIEKCIEEKSDSSDAKYATFRTLYNCTASELEPVELINLSNVDTDNINRDNQWHYVDSFVQNDETKIVYYYYSNQEESNVSNFTYPSNGSINDVDCLKLSGASNVNSVKNIDQMEMFVDGVIGDASVANGKYLLVSSTYVPSEGSEGSIGSEETDSSSLSSSSSSSSGGTIVDASWTLVTPLVSIDLKYISSNSSFVLNMIFKSESGNVQISGTINYPKYFISQILSISTVSIKYKYGLDEGICGVGFNGVISDLVGIQGEALESSSEGSEGSEGSEASSAS